MIRTTAFDYINVLDKAADASWKRENIIANNIANVNTPGFKRSDVDFSTLLKQELGNFQSESLDEKMKRVDLRNLDVTAHKDFSEYSYRLDGNNVDIDTEQVELASEQIKYQALTSSISQEFARMKSVIS